MTVMVVFGLPGNREGLVRVLQCRSCRILSLAALRHVCATCAQALPPAQHITATRRPGRSAPGLLLWSQSRRPDLPPQHIP